ncbi:MAG: hypothetical protein CMJ68_04535 [Planctomycetaceae bacterium]|nr:hypothetical protein [Planctomycetaceae bacterium]
MIDLNRPANVSAEQQRARLDLIAKLNDRHLAANPGERELAARIYSYELAARMQMAAPEAVDISRETASTRRLYGMEKPISSYFGRQCLLARRLVERGARFVQVYPSPYGVWDSHNSLKKNHATQSAKVDKPVAGLLKDLKRRGMLNDVLVVFCTEFGRTPAVEGRAGGADGRDHHPHGFTVWFAGAGVKRGFIHGATDELGFHAVEPGHYVTDIHATVLHLMGLDGRRLEVPGRKRLEIDHGNPIREILT